MRNLKARVQRLKEAVAEKTRTIAAAPPDPEDDKIDMETLKEILKILWDAGAADAEDALHRAAIAEGDDPPCTPGMAPYLRELAALGWFESDSLEFPDLSHLEALSAEYRRGCAGC